MLFSVADWPKSRIPQKMPLAQTPSEAATEPAGWRAGTRTSVWQMLQKSGRGFGGGVVAGGEAQSARSYGPISSGICFPPLSHANTDLSSYGKPTITETSPKKLCRSVTDGVAGPLGCEWTMPI